MAKSIITTEELVSASGVSSRTLLRWYKKGIIPAPRIGLHKSGKGKTGYWPKRLVKYCKRIREFQTSGYKLELAAKLAEAEFVQKIMEATKPPLPQDQRFAELVESLKFHDEDAAEEIFSQLVNGLAKSKANRFTQEVINVSMSQLYKDAQKKIKQGFNPILWCGEDLAEVIPDIVVGLRFTEKGRGYAPVLVMPLYETMVEVAKILGNKNPELPINRPPNSFIRGGGFLTKEWGISLTTSRSGYEIGDPIEKTETPPANSQDKEKGKK